MAMFSSGAFVLRFSFCMSSNGIFRPFSCIWLIYINGLLNLSADIGRYPSVGFEKFIMGSSDLSSTSPTIGTLVLCMEVAIVGFEYGLWNSTPSCEIMRLGTTGWLTGYSRTIG